MRIDTHAQSQPHHIGPPACSAWPSNVSPSSLNGSPLQVGGLKTLRAAVSFKPPAGRFGGRAVVFLHPFAPPTPERRPLGGLAGLNRSAFWIMTFFLVLCIARGIFPGCTFGLLDLVLFCAALCAFTLRRVAARWSVFTCGCDWVAALNAPFWYHRCRSPGLPVRSDLLVCYFSSITAARLANVFSFAENPATSLR